MVLHMVHKLFRLLGRRRLLGLRGSERIACTLLCAGLVVLGMHHGGAESVVIDSRGTRLPLEVEQGVHWLDLNPPRAPLHGFADQARIVSRSHNELVTVFQISVFKGNVASGFGFSDRFLMSSQLCLPQFDHLELGQSWRQLLDF